MGFFDKVKKVLGIGGVKMKVEMPLVQFQKGSGEVSGKITLTTQTDQFIKDITVKVSEDWTTGRGDEKQTKTFTLGEVTVAQGFDIKAGETKEYSFKCPYQNIKSENDSLKEGGSVQKTLGKLGAFMDVEKSKYEVVVHCDVKGVLMSPSETIKIQMT